MAACPAMARQHAAGILFALPDGRVLFLKRAANAGDHPNEWCFPGGTIDAGERPKNAAMREAQEETGFDAPVRLGRPIDETNGFVTFRVRLGGPFAAQLNDEHTQAVWAHPTAAPQPLHPGCAALFDKLWRRDHPTTQYAGVRFTAAGKRLMAMDAKPTIAPVRPAAPTRIGYERRIDALVEEMAASVIYWLRATYRAAPPATIAQDASATTILQAAFDKLRARWLRKFDELAPKMADWFVGQSKGRVDTQMRLDLRKAGFTVKFRPTKAMNDAYGAVIEENIGLIKSIGQQHLAAVQTDLMQSVQNGRDLGYLTEKLTERTGITKRRAARIARDQNAKATSVMQRTRALELGVTRAIWLHSAGGKTPRPDHVAFNGHEFSLADGHDFNNGEGVVWPGTAISCRCVFKMVVPGFD